MESYLTMNVLEILYFKDFTISPSFINNIHIQRHVVSQIKKNNVIG